MHSFKDKTTPAVWPDPTIALSILERLSGFIGYPKTPKGTEIFVEALLSATSEEHALAAVDVFDERFPTLRELRDSIFKARQKFEPPVDLIEKWKADGATYDPDFVVRTIREVLDAAERREAEQREKLLKLGKEPVESEHDKQVREILESIDSGYGDSSENPS